MGQGNLHEMPVKITKTVVDAGSVQTEPTKTYQRSDNLNRSGRQFVKTDTKTDSDASGPKVIKKIIRSPLAKLPTNPVLLNKVGNAK